MEDYQDILDELMRQAGLTGRHLASGTVGLGAAFANPIAATANKGLELAGSDYRFPDQYEAAQDFMSEMGVPEPQTATEKGVGFFAELGVPDPTDAAKVTSAIQHLFADPEMAGAIVGAVGRGLNHTVDTTPTSSLTDTPKRGEIILSDGSKSIQEALMRREYAAPAIVGTSPTTAKPHSRQFGEAMGMYHEIGGNKKLPQPFHEFNRTVSDWGTPIEMRTIDPETLKNASFFPLIGDRTQAGTWLHGLGNTMFDEPVKLQGGYEYMRYNPDRIWASGQGVVTGLNRKVQDILNRGREPMGIYMPMAHTGTDFSDMISKVILHQVRGLELDNPTVNKFDRMMKRRRKDWKGLEDPDTERMMFDTGALRKEFLNVADLEEFRKRGFPSKAYARWAVTDPDLVDVNKTPQFHGGQAVGRATGKQQPGTHPSYSTDMMGEYQGRFAKPVPWQQLFPDFMEYTAKTSGQKVKHMTPDNQNYTFRKTQPVQDVDQQIIDALMLYLQ